MKKKLFFLFVIIFIVGAYFYFQNSENKSDLQYMTIRPHKGDITSKVLATGMLEGSKQVSVGAQVSGQLQKLFVEEGDDVKQGELLAQIDSRTQKNSLKDAEAELNTYKAKLISAKATLKKEQLEFERQQRLMKGDASTKSAFESAEANLAVAKANVHVLEEQIKQAEIRVDTAKINVGYTQITSPIDGIVIAIVTDEGQTVVSNQTATTILKMATMDTMTVKAEISEADVVKVKPGMDVEFTILGDPKRIYRSKLKKVAPAPTTESSSSNSNASSTSSAIYYNAEFDVDNSDKSLRVSMTAECSIILAQKKDTLLLPISSLRTNPKNGKYFVKIKTPEGSKVVEVETGLKDDTSIEIVAGLTETDEIILGDDIATAERKMKMADDKKRRGPPHL